MKKFFLYSMIFSLAGLLGACKDDDNKSVAEEPYFTVQAEEVVFGAAQKTKAITISSNLVFTAASDEDWCTTEIVAGESNNLKISVTASTAERSAKITVAAEGFDSKVITIKQMNVLADILDVVWAADGSATDVSPLQNPVLTPNKKAVTRLDTKYGLYVAQFPGRDAWDNPEDPNAESDEGRTSTYYKVDYGEVTATTKPASAEAMRNAFTGSFSFEVLVKITTHYKDWTRFISTEDAGGVGFGMELGDPDKSPYFGFEVGATGLEEGNYLFLMADKTPSPEVGKFYHGVAVNDVDAKKIIIYINGQKIAEMDASASTGYKFPGNGPNSQWLAIGADGYGNENYVEHPLGTIYPMAQKGFEGELAIARMYGKALSPAEVAYLYGEVK